MFLFCKIVDMEFCFPIAGYLQCRFVLTWMRSEQKLRLVAVVLWWGFEFLGNHVPRWPCNFAAVSFILSSYMWFLLICTPPLASARKLMCYCQIPKDELIRKEILRISNVLLPSSSSCLISVVRICLEWLISQNFRVWDVHLYVGRLDFEISSNLDVQTPVHPIRPGAM